MTTGFNFIEGTVEADEAVEGRLIQRNHAGCATFVESPLVCPLCSTARLYRVYNLKDVMRVVIVKEPCPPAANMIGAGVIACRKCTLSPIPDRHTILYCDPCDTFFTCDLKDVRDVLGVHL